MSLYLDENNLRRVGMSPANIATLRTLTRLTTTTGSTDLTAVLAAIAALQSADTALDGRLDATEAVTNDATIQALKSYDGDGFVVQTAPNVFEGRALIEGDNVSITYPDGVSGDPVISAVSYIPMVDGSIPPNLLYEPDGTLVLEPYP